MKHLATILVLCLLGTLSAQARLGFTLDQLTDLLGPPQTIHIPSQEFAGGKYVKFGDNYTFHKDPYTVVCCMLNGYCAQVSYSKNGAWTEEQIQTILNLNSQGCIWTETSKPVPPVFANTPIGDPHDIRFHPRSWSRSDGGTATGAGVGITITTPKFIYVEQQAIDQANQDNTKTPAL